MKSFARFVVDHAPCADGEHHTSYVVVPAEVLGHVCVFPEANFRLTSAEHRASIRRQLLAEFGLILDEPDEEGP